MWTYTFHQLHFNREIRSYPFNVTLSDSMRILIQYFIYSSVSILGSIFSLPSIHPHLISTLQNIIGYVCQTNSQIVKSVTSWILDVNREIRIIVCTTLLMDLNYDRSISSYIYTSFQHLY